MKAKIIDFAEQQLLRTRPVKPALKTKAYRLLHAGKPMGADLHLPSMAIEAACFAAAEAAGFNDALLGDHPVTTTIHVHRIDVDPEGREVFIPHATVRYTAGSYMPRIEDPEPTLARPQAPSA